MDRRACRTPTPPTLGSAGCENPPTDTVNRRQQAMSRLAVYSDTTSGLGWPQGPREPLPSPHSQCLSLHFCICLLCLPLSLPSVPLALSGFPCLPPRLCLSLGPGLGQTTSTPQWKGCQASHILAPGWLCGIRTAVRLGLLSLSLSLISGGPFSNLLYFIVLGGMFWGVGEKSLFSRGVSVPSETYQSHI